ncbi:hypothetical protein EGW08_022584, partial [Elysia chlorotica]
ECPSGKYGTGCLLNCADNCNGQTTCEAETGACNRCPLGKTGEFCNQDCSFGKYGLGCNHFCSEYCHKGICNKVDGSCTQGCVANWKPPFCLTCTDGFYGAKCGNHCSDFCLNKVCESPLGACISCIEGHEGLFCDHHNEGPDKGVPKGNYVSAIIVLLSLILFLLVMSICVNSELNERKFSFEKSKTALVRRSSSGGDESIRDTSIKSGFAWDTSSISSTTITDIDEDTLDQS